MKGKTKHGQWLKKGQNEGSEPRSIRGNIETYFLTLHEVGVGTHDLVPDYFGFLKAVWRSFEAFYRAENDVADAGSRRRPLNRGANFAHNYS